MNLKRDYLIDFLRTIAIILMVFAHSRMILNLQTNFVNESIQNLGNTVCFVIFLTCFGAALNYSYQKNKDISVLKNLKRVAQIYLAYLIISVLTLIETKATNLGPFIKFATFQSLPAYAEFLVAFMIYLLLFTFGRKFFSYLAKSFWIFLVASLAFFLLGSILSLVNFGGLQPIANLFVGKRDIYSFPIFQYMPFFLAGIYYIKRSLTHPFGLRNYIGGLLTLSGIYLVLINLNIFGGFQEAVRWPPNLRFVFYGFLSILFLVSVFEWSMSILRQNLKDKLLTLAYIPSKYALHVFYVHLIILYIFRWTKVPKSYIINYIVTAFIVGLFYLFFYTRKALIKNNEKPRIQ